MQSPVRTTITRFHQMPKRKLRPLPDGSQRRQNNTILNYLGWNVKVQEKRLFVYMSSSILYHFLVSESNQLL